MKNNFLKIINEKIDANKLNRYNYISTDNMVPNFGGVTIANSIPNGRCTLFRNGDILLSNIRPYFKKVWYATFDGGTSNDVIVLRSDNRFCLSKFLYYEISSDKFLNNYNANSKGTKMPRGDKSILLTYDFNLPDLVKQQHIVDTIGSVDDLIEKYQLIIKKIQNLRSLLFMDFCKENNESVEICSLVSFVSGAQPPKKQHIYEPREGYVRFIQNRDYSSSSHMTYIPVSRKNKICNKFDIMIDKYGDAGTTRCGIDGAYNVALLKVVPNKETYREYIRDFLSQEEIRKLLDASSQASTRASLNEGTFNGIKIPFDENNVEKYEEITRPFQSLNFAINDDIQKLENIKNLLLQKYFN